MVKGAALPRSLRLKGIATLHKSEVCRNWVEHPKQCAGRGIRLCSIRAAVSCHSANFLHRLRNELRKVEAAKRLSPRYRSTYLLACLARHLHQHIAT